jgi:hypothetical protein
MVELGIKSVRRAWRTVVARPLEEPSISVGLLNMRIHGRVRGEEVPIMARRYFPLVVVFVRPMVGALCVTG